MSLMNYGYKKEEIQIRKMAMAELRLGVVQELLKKNYRYVEIELISMKEILVYEESEKISKIRIVILIRECDE